MRFAVGDVLLHARHGWACAVVGWSDSCEASEAWMKAARVETLSHGRDQPFYHCLAAPFASSEDSAHDCERHGGSHRAQHHHPDSSDSQSAKRTPCSGLRIYAAQENLRPFCDGSTGHDHDTAGEVPRRQAASASQAAVMELLLGHGDALAAHFHSLDMQHLRFNRSELLEEMYPHDGPWGFERQLLQSESREGSGDSEIPLTRLASAASSGRGRLASLITL